MKQRFLVIIAILCFTTLNAQSSKLFIITKSKIQGKEMFSYKLGISYIDRTKTIIYIVGDKIYSSDKVKKARSYYEQGLYIEEYIPIDLLSNKTKYIYRLAYDSKGGTPVLVTEISFRTKRNYQIQFYYTDYFFELRKKH